VLEFGVRIICRFHLGISLAVVCAAIASTMPAQAQVFMEVQVTSRPLGDIEFDLGARRPQLSLIQFWSGKFTVELD
jgi:hypothetical protein